MAENILMNFAMQRESELEKISNEVHRTIKCLRQNYKHSGKPQEFCFRDFRNLLKSQSNGYTHQIHYYPAKILIDIPNFFLFDPECARDGAKLLDPFAGTGTVLLAGLTHPHCQMNTLGVEINPLARMISKVKCTPLDVDELKEESEVLLDKIRRAKDQYEIPDFPNRDFWFVKKAQRELSKIKHFVGEVKNKQFQDFFWACFSTIIRKSSLADPRVPPPVILKAENFRKKDQKKEIEEVVMEKQNPKPLRYFKEEIEKNIIRLEQLSRALSDSEVRAEIIWDDVKTLKYGSYSSKGKIQKQSAKPLRNVQLVVTSPPYINAQKYIRTLKLEMLWLGMVTYDELLELDQKYVGTERVYSENYNELIEVGDKLADATVRKIFRSNKRRAGIVANYYRDMLDAMKNIYKCMKKEGRFVLVIGNNSVLNHRVKNHQILTNIAMNDIGFEVEFILKDEILSRGLFTKRHYSADIIPEEWIVVLKKPNN